MPLGILVLIIALIIALEINSLVPQCIGWDFTITGQPLARALAVSPPAVENAKGKLLAPKTTTGPRATDVFRKSGFGKGFLLGSAISIKFSLHFSFSIKLANEFSWFIVLPIFSILILIVSFLLRVMSFGGTIPVPVIKKTPLGKEHSLKR